MDCRDILVVIDGFSSSWDAVEDAGRLAEAANARVTLLAVHSRTIRWLASFAAVPPMSLPKPAGFDPDQELGVVLARAVDLVPSKVPVTTIISTGSARAAVRRARRSAVHGAIIDGTRRGLHRRGRWVLGTHGSHPDREDPLGCVRSQ
jgi:hypothetical protein